MSKIKIVRMIAITLIGVGLVGCNFDEGKSYKQRVWEQLRACGHNYSAEYMDLLSNEGAATLLTNSRCDGR